MTAQLATFTYGSFSHNPAEVQFQGINRTFVQSPNGKNARLRIAWGLKGRIVAPMGYSGNPLQYLQGLLAIRQRAYSVNNQTAVMYDQTGVSTNWILSANSPDNVGGVRVTNFISHGALKGADGVLSLEYTFGLEGEYFWVGANEVLNFTEQLSFSGNGNGMQVVKRPINSGIILQQTTQASEFLATQAGSLTQRGPNPSPGIVLFPASLIPGPEGTKIVYSSPSMVRGTDVDYTVTWQYSYRSASQLFSQVRVVR